MIEGEGRSRRDARERKISDSVIKEQIQKNEKEVKPAIKWRKGEEKGKEAKNVKNEIILFVLNNNNIYLFNITPSRHRGVGTHHAVK